MLTARKRQPIKRARIRSISGVAASAVGLLSLDAAAADPTPDLEQVVVTATRVEQSSFDLPVSVDSLARDAIADGQLQVNLSEALVRVPGLVVQNRQNYAQDLQISSRGFGARSTFGVRGIRLYVDGIPATQPDGQGQVSNIDLASAGRIEVLRGPFSALYGNSAGGVIAVFSEDGKPGAAVDALAEFGSFGLSRQALKVSGDADGFNYLADLSDFHIDGIRPHSAAKRANGNAKLRYSFGDGSDLTLLANTVAVSAQDPLGLTRAQFNTNLDQAGTGALTYNTRKAIDQEQTGLVYHRPLGDADTAELTVYGGSRNVGQFQAIPASTEVSPASSGGVIDLAVGYWGTDLHVSDRRAFGSTTLRVTGGISYDDLSEARKGYQNFVGTVLGIEGALRRNETDRVYDVDEYIQAELDPDPHWVIEAGLRHSAVEVTSKDHYIVAGNGDDSGGAAYEATLPVAGVTYRITPLLNAYASYGRGFQTPTLDELAYRSTSGTVTGLNFGLRPSFSDNYEIGIKSWLDDHVRATAAAFHIDTSDELVVAANLAGRSVYQNAGNTTRDGVELSVNGKWPGGFGAAASYTYLRATYGTAFVSCPGTPCVPTRIPAGNRLPGVPMNAAWGEVSWADADLGFSTAVELHLESRVFVNDTNSDAAPFWLTAGYRAGFEQALDRFRFKEFLRIENIAGRHYAGSVIVSETSGRYFEPAPGRTGDVGLSASIVW